MGKAATVHERETTPPVSLLKSYANIRRYTDELMVLFQAQHVDRQDGAESCVAYHQRMLGRQTCCWVGGSQSRRFYIWDRPKWRIYVHNAGGVGFEVPVGASPEDMWAALADYGKLTGFGAP